MSSLGSSISAHNSPYRISSWVLFNTFVLSVGLYLHSWLLHIVSHHARNILFFVLEYEPSDFFRGEKKEKTYVERMVE
jgi:hypothetical protein